jgi:hypothetical protein
METSAGVLLCHPGNFIQCFFFQFFLLARESVLLLHHQFEKGQSFFIGLMGSTSSVFEFNLSEKCMQMFVFKHENVFNFAFYSDIG